MWRRSRQVCASGERTIAVYQRSCDRLLRRGRGLAARALTANRYSYFGDEMCHMACGEHMARWCGGRDCLYANSVEDSLRRLAALCSACAGVYLILRHLFTMNVFEPLLWMSCAYVVIRIIKTGNQKQREGQRSRYFVHTAWVQ